MAVLGHRQLVCYALGTLGRDGWLDSANSYIWVLQRQGTEAGSGEHQE